MLGASRSEEATKLAPQSTRGPEATSGVEEAVKEKGRAVTGLSILCNGFAKIRSFRPIQYIRLELGGHGPETGGETKDQTVRLSELLGGDYRDVGLGWHVHLGLHLLG